MNIKCEVCKSLLQDTDWEVKGGRYRRGPFVVCPETGEIDYYGALVPMTRWGRRCVRKHIRLRQEKQFQALGWTGLKAK